MSILKSRFRFLKPKQLGWMPIRIIPSSSIGSPTDRRRPADRDVLGALVSISRERGDLKTALGHAETLAALLPEDQRVRALRDDLRRQRGEGR